MPWRATASGGSRRGCRRGLLALAVIVTAGAGAAGPARATVLTPTTAPLPGSTFQGADGNQDGPGLTDWQGRQGANLVRHNPDPNGEDSAFSGGDKETEPSGWKLTTERGGVNPAKANIRDAWASVDQPAADTFLYLGFTREKADGTTFLTFELNRDARLWDNGESRIPCRRTGDIQVSYEAQGNTVDVVLRRWVTTSADAKTGCARTGRLDDFSGLTANVEAQGAINGAAVPSRLPGAITGTVPAGQFGEASLNLSALLERAFGDDCLAFASIWMHSRSSTSVSSNMQDYVGPQPLAVRTCSASGTKFYDVDADGVRDPGEPGIPRFVVWADYNDDGVRDANEPYSVTDDQGQYVIFDIRPPSGSYHLREGLLTGRARRRAITDEWICSFPKDSTQGGTGSAPGRFGCAWGPIDVATMPDADGRDFGNWYPAQLTVEKQIEPADDPGRFDLLLDGTVVLPAAGDGASFTTAVVPGSHTVSEQPAGDTNAADYRSSVDCRRNVNRRGRRRAAVSAGITLAAGEQGLCTFRNIRAGVPAIAIRKTGPASATAGDTLHYTLLVTNPGFVPFPEAAVTVTDPACDDAPELVDKQDGSGPDDSPGTLDPLVDTWTYRCSRKTAAPGGDCVQTRVDNTATATGTADGKTVDDSDSISTILTCPDQPEPPIPEPPIPPGPGPAPDPDVPGPVVPPGPTPPDAGDSGVAGIVVRSAALRRCIRTHVPRVTFSGARVASVRIYVDGRRSRSLNLRTLQSRVRPRVTLAPGRHRVTARVAFQRGSGTPPVTLSRVVRVCAAAAAAPQFTG